VVMGLEYHSSIYTPKIISLDSIFVVHLRNRIIAINLTLLAPDYQRERYNVKNNYT
jgi:hypothetical protein